MKINKIFNFKKKNSSIKKDLIKKRVLVVEDDALLADILMDSILAEGFEALNVVEGSKVLEVTKAYNPHIILLDIILPGLDGFGVLKELKAESSTAKIPVFILSNLDSVSDVKSAKVLGAEEYFIKARSEIKKIITAIKAKLEK